MRLAMLYNTDYAIALVYAWDAAWRLMRLKGTAKTNHWTPEELQDFVRAYNGH